MPQKSDDNHALKPMDLVFLLAIAGRIDAQCRIFSKQLDEDRSVYYAYAALDSLSSSYSMFKYFWDVFLPNSNNDAMHDFLLSPNGIAIATAETLFLVGFSVLAVKFDNEKDDAFKKFIAEAWPYIRDIIKGLKNAYKGWRGVLQALNGLGVDLNFLIIPIGIGLGIFAAANRCWLRNMVEKRKVMMTENSALRRTIKELLTMTEQEAEQYLKQIKYQEITTRYLSFIGVGLGGFVDGLYMYFGLIGLALLSHVLLCFIVAMSIFYTAACIITRIYEEHDFQVRLFITQTQCQLEVLAKQIETTYAELFSMIELNHKIQKDWDDIEFLKLQLHDFLEAFEIKRALLDKQSSRSYLSAFLLGLKNGLYAYGALTSAIFVLSVILIIAKVAFPPALIISAAIIGLALIAYFITHALIVNYYHVQSEDKEAPRPYNQLIDLKNKIKWSLDIEDEFIETKEIQASLNDGFEVHGAPQTVIQEWCEFWRSLFSGFAKGQKFVDFAGNVLQEQNEQGHYQDTPFKYILALLAALLFALVLALRALARGFGRAPLGQETPEKKSVELDTSANIGTEGSDEDCMPEPEILEAPVIAIMEAEDIKTEPTPSKPEKRSLPIATNRLFCGFFETNKGTATSHLTEEQEELLQPTIIF